MPKQVRVNELSKQMVAIIKFVGYLQSTGVKKDTVLESVAGKAWTELQRIPKPVTDGFDALVSKYHMIVNKHGRYFLTPDGQTVFDHYDKKAEANVNIETIAAVTGGCIVGAAVSKFEQRVRDWAGHSYSGAALDEIVALIKRGGNLTTLVKQYKHLGYGVESVELDSPSGKHLGFDYINAGDTYTTTLLRNPLTRKLELTTVGDMVEYLEKKGYTAL